MKRKQILFFSLSFLVLLTLFPAHAQVKPGFKHLKKKRYEKAEALFLKAAQKPLEAPIAGLGLYRIQERTLSKDSLYPIAQAYRRISALSSSYDMLPKKNRDRYAELKGVRIKKSDYNNARRNLIDKAFKVILTRRSMADLDSCVAWMGPFTGPDSTSYQRMEDQVVLHNFYSDDYPTLLSIVQNHDKALKRLHLDPAAIRFSTRILDAFIRQYPLHDFRRFTTEIPMNWASNDCLTPEFLDAVEQRQLKPIAELLDRNPNSNMDLVAVSALAWPQNQGLLNSYQADSSDTSAAAMLYAGSRLLFYGFPEGTSPDNIVATIKYFIQENAPSNRAYMCLLKGLEALKTHAAWQESLELVRYAKPFFENMHLQPGCMSIYQYKNKAPKWFDSIAKVLDSPDQPFSISGVGLPNTVGDEFSPLISPDEIRLHFSREWESEFFAKDGDILTSFFVDSAWTKPVPDTTMNQPGSNALYSLDIYSRQWTYAQDGGLAVAGVPKPDSLFKVLSVFKWVGKACLSPNGKALVFESSDDLVPIDNDSDIDLYVTTFDEVAQKWRVAMKMSVNTFFKERSPFIHTDNKTLLFSSNGLHSFAGTDIYKSQRLDDTWVNWSQPENVGKEINGYLNDGDYLFSAPAHGRHLYYSTKTEEHDSKGDLFKMTLPKYAQLPRVVLLLGTMSLYTPKLFMRAISDLSTDTVDVDEGKVLFNGNFTLPVVDEGQDSIYYFADDPAYYSTFVPLCLKTASDVQTIEKMPYVVKISELISKELPIPSEHLQFEPGSAELTPSAKRELNWLARYFKFYRQTVLVAGHCGLQENGKNKDALSLARAEAVKAYLITRGMRWDRIWTQGFADKKPLKESLIPVRPPHARRVEIYIKTQ